MSYSIGCHTLNNGVELDKAFTNQTYNKKYSKPNKTTIVSYFPFKLSAIAKVELNIWQRHSLNIHSKIMNLNYKQTQQKHLPNALDFTYTVYSHLNMSNLKYTYDIYLTVACAYKSYVDRLIT